MTNRTVNRIDVAALALMIVAAIVLLALTATTANAQIKLGKVKNAVTKAVVPAAVSPAAGSGVKTGNVTFDNRVLEITEERLDQLMVGLGAETEMAARVEGQDLEAIDRANAAADATYDKELAAYNASKDKHERCTGAITKDLEKQIAPSMPTEQDRVKMEAIAARVKAAKDAGNIAEVRRISDSIAAAMNPAAQRMTAQTNAAAARASSECGAQPVKPTRPDRQNPLTWADVYSAGAKASGMSMEQYQILRERVAPYVLSRGKSSDMMYTSSEVDAMQAKSDALGKWGMALKT